MKKRHISIIILGVLILLGYSVIRDTIMGQNESEKSTNKPILSNPFARLSPSKPAQSKKGSCSLLKLAAGWSMKDEGETDVKQCIAAGADINERDQYGNTPLHIATHWSVFDLQILEGKSGKSFHPDILIQDTFPPNKEIVKPLLALGADVNAKNNAGETPLVSAFDYDDTELLLEHGADPNVQDQDGDTRLHIAALIGDEKQIALLLKYGADTTIKNHYGLTPLEVALSKGADAVEILKTIHSDKMAEELNISYENCIKLLKSAETKK